MFSHNGSRGLLNLEYLCGHPAAASSQNFPTYSPGGAMLFNFVVIYMAANCARGQSLLCSIALLMVRLYVSRTAPRRR